MEPTHCQSCKRSGLDAPLQYRRGAEVVTHEGFLQCDICERYACARCLQVYDILSGYDFLCHVCALVFEPPAPWTKSH